MSQVVTFKIVPGSDARPGIVSFSTDNIEAALQRSPGAGLNTAVVCFTGGLRGTGSSGSFPFDHFIRCLEERTNSSSISAYDPPKTVPPEARHACLLLVCSKVFEIKTSESSHCGVILMDIEYNGDLRPITVKLPPEWTPTVVVHNAFDPQSSEGWRQLRLMPAPHNEPIVLIHNWGSPDWLPYGSQSEGVTFPFFASPCSTPEIKSNEPKNLRTFLLPHPVDSFGRNSEEYENWTKKFFTLLLEPLSQRQQKRAMGQGCITPPTVCCSPTPDVDPGRGTSRPPEQSAATPSYRPHSSTTSPPQSRKDIEKPTTEPGAIDSAEESPSEQEAKAVVVRSESDPEYLQLHEKVLLDIMEAPGVADLPVSVLSIAGGFRQGKSFLLGYIVRYLEQLESGKPAEGINTPDAPLRGFPWKYGESKITTGMLVWGKVFKVTTKNHGQVAVILIDTEGTFDDTSTVTGNASIMSLSMVVSSVQIYNVSQNINQNDLQHLQLFSSYARVAQGEGCGQSSKPFQKMVFLVRDWMYPDDHQYGLEGGNAFLNTWLNRGGPSKCADHITSTFDNIECFLMPHPGDKVKKLSFDGRLSGLSDEFKEHLNDLISSLVSPDKLVLKEVNGKPLKCRDLPRIFQEYFETCKGGQLGGPRTHFEATADATNQSTLEAILRTYTAGIEEVMQDPACDIHQLWKADEELRQLCSSKLEHASLMGAKPHELEAKMSKEIDASFRRFERSMLEIQKSKDDDQARLNDLKRQCEEEQDKITKDKERHEEQLAVLERHARAEKLEKEKLEQKMRQTPDNNSITCTGNLGTGSQHVNEGSSLSAPLPRRTKKCNSL